MNKIKYTHNENGKSEKGFTLIEVLVAIAILSFGLIAMNFMQTQSVRGNAGAQMLTETVWIASDTIDGLLAEDYDDVVSGDCETVSGDLEKHICAGLPTDYNVSWTVPPTTDVNVKNIRITVKYKPLKNKEFVYEYKKTNLL